MSLKHRFRQIKKPPVWTFIPIVFFIRLMRIFMRLKIHDPNGCLNPETFPYVTVLWHNRLLFVATLFPKYARKKTFAMISASRDGEYISNIVKLFGVRTVRGSSSRKGAGALRGALNVLKDGANLIMTPDGPRGPRYHLSKGPIILASKTGFPILTLGINYSSYWELRSWDKFRIPKPWSRIELIFGEPFNVPPDLDDKNLEQWRSKIEKQLNEVSRVEDKDKPAEKTS